MRTVAGLTTTVLLTSFATFLTCCTVADPPLTADEAHRLAGSSNARDLFELAARSLKNPLRVRLTSNDGPDDKSRPSAQLVAVVRSNPSILGWIAQALKRKLSMDDLHHGVAFQDFGSDFTVFAWGRRLTDFACEAGDVALSEGHVKEALADDELGFGIGTKFLADGSIIPEGIDGAALESTARRAIERVAPQLAADDLARSAKFLASAAASHRPFQEVLLSDFRVQEAMLENIGGGYATPSDILAHRRQISEAVVQRDTGVFARRSPLSPRADQGSVGDTAGPRYDESAPVFDQAWFASLNDQTEDCLLALKLASKAYRRQRSTWPKRIQDLSPTFIGHVPDDPFMPGRPLRMRAAGADLVIYSVGPDGVDNGGRPVAGKLTAYSKGDVVEMVSASQR